MQDRRSDLTSTLTSVSTSTLTSRLTFTLTSRLASTFRRNRLIVFVIVVALASLRHVAERRDDIGSGPDGDVNFRPVAPDDLPFVLERSLFEKNLSEDCRRLYRDISDRRFNVGDEFQRTMTTRCTPKCDDLLFQTARARPAAEEFTATFREMETSFFGFVDETLRKYPQTERDTYYFPLQFRSLHQIVRLPFVRTVCETGFSAGRSSFNYLTANPTVVLHSFDMGNEPYTKPIAAFVGRMFPGRFFIHYGVSRRTVPRFALFSPNVRCDVMIVDGGHVYAAGRADVLNFASMANLERNLIVFDDYPVVGGALDAYGVVWERALRRGLVRERFRCTYSGAPDRVERGFTLGTVVKRPDAISRKNI